MTDEEMAREWLREHCSRESFLIFGETWTELLAALLRDVRAEEGARVLDYHQHSTGTAYVDGVAKGRKEERARIVAWMRQKQLQWFGGRDGSVAMGDAADLLERGEADK